MRRFLRSPQEYGFRLRQELNNLLLLRLPQPSPSGAPPLPLPFLPSPAAVVQRLSGTSFASELVSIADSILRHQFPALGTTLETGPEIQWRRDYSSGIETDTRYFRRIPFLDASRVGDHKLIWELNRHQHLVVLAQVAVLTGEEPYFQAISDQLESWFAANPFQRGINWCSALEVAFRALSWIWVYHLVGNRLPGAFLKQLYWHGCHLEANLSHYFSPNTHLLGEAVALHALGLVFGNRNWERRGARVVDQQMEVQVRDDGSHFEQSSYYHLYALDMFLFHALLRPEFLQWSAKLERMAEYLRALLGRGRTLPLLGDDDGGRFFHPYGPRQEFGCATLATCSVILNRPDLWAEPEDLYPQAAWWLGPTALDSRLSNTAPALNSRLFPGAGVAVMTAGSNHIVADAGSFGPWASGHSHSDTLSVLVRTGVEEILIDAGTFTYMGDARDWFRGSSAHNTIRIDGRDQAEPASAFGWTGQPQVRIRVWTTSETRDYLDAECRYAGFAHRRRILLIKPDLLLIVDDIDGPAGEHSLEQFWHSGAAVAALSANCFRLGTRSVLFLDGKGELEEGGENGWRSPAFGRRSPAPVIRVLRRAALPSRFATGLLLSGQGDLQMAPTRAEFRWRTENSEQIYRMPEGAETADS